MEPNETPPPADGKSAYDLWLEQGNSGTVQQFLASLQGEPGHCECCGENDSVLSPAQLHESLLLWVDPQDAASMRADSNGKVSTGVLNKGFGTDILLPLNPANAPSYDAQDKALVFGQTPLLSSVPHTLSSFTLLLVVEDATASPAETFIGCDKLTAAALIMFYLGRHYAESNLFSVDLFNGFLLVPAQGTTPPPNTFGKSLLSLTLEGGLATLRLNGGASTASGASAPLVEVRLSLGGDYTGGNLSDCKQYELIGTTNSSTYARDVLEGYLAWRHGIQAGLPSAHPFASAPPPSDALLDSALLTHPCTPSMTNETGLFTL